MNRWMILRHGLSLSATVALVSGCGAAQAIDGSSAVPLSSVHSGAVEEGRQWMPAGASDSNLVYVADYGAGVIVYAYRASHLKYVGYISNPQNAEGECIDKSQDIFITDSADEIFEYARGGASPIAVINDPYATPLNCAVNPTNGDLAVVGYPLLGGSYGVAIYKHARGKPTFYSAGDFGDYECGYDDKGNLFIDGYVFSGRMNFAELPKGGTAFRNITLNQSFNAAGGIQWDGQHLAVGDLYNAVIYQFDIKGDKGMEVGSTPLDGAGTVWQFFIDRGKVIVPSTFEDGSGTVGIYAYPAGGVVKRTRNVYSPEGVVVSKRDV